MDLYLRYCKRDLFCPMPIGVQARMFGSGSAVESHRGIWECVGHRQALIRIGTYSLSTREYWKPAIQLWLDVNTHTHRSAPANEARRSGPTLSTNVACQDCTGPVPLHRPHLMIRRKRLWLPWSEGYQMNHRGLALLGFSSEYHDKRLFLLVWLQVINKKKKKSRGRQKRLRTYQHVTLRQYYVISHPHSQACIQPTCRASSTLRTSEPTSSLPILTSLDLHLPKHQRIIFSPTSAESLPPYLSSPTYVARDLVIYLA